MLTQNQVAKLAGVSRSTVARVVNNSTDVNPETRDRILGIMKEHGYRPNKAGQVLVNQHKKLKVACMIIQSDNPFYDQINEGILQQADEFEQYGIEVIIEKVPFIAEEQIKAIDQLCSENISALAIQPVIDRSLCDKLKEVEEKGIPVVTINTDLPNYQSSFCYVGNDFYVCGQTAANLMQLFTNGKCNIGILTGFKKAKSHADRIAGFTDYIKKYTDMKVICLEETRDDDMEAYYLTKTMLREHTEIDAMFLVAGGVYGSGKAIKDIMAETGKTYTVISFDDIATTRDLVREGIIKATICQQPVRQGNMALAVIFDYLIEGRKPQNNRLYTDIQIKVRANIDI